jgi:serine/threonine protein kinase
LQTLRRQVQHSRDMRLKPDAQNGAAYVQELQLQRRIGKGGFGTVYAGKHTAMTLPLKRQTCSQQVCLLLLLQYVGTHRVTPM